MNLKFDLQNITDNEGLAISLVGMTLVFLGLVLVSLFISILPRILETYDRMIRQGAGEGSLENETHEEDAAREAEIRAAIATVLEMALAEDDGSALQRITIRRSRSESMWREIGQMRSLSSKPPY